MSDDTNLEMFEERLVLAVQSLLAGRQPDTLPGLRIRRYQEALRQLSALLAEPPSDAVGSEVAERAVRECAAAGWRVGLHAAQVLRALPALERAEKRLRNRPEALQRETTGWQMLNRLFLSGTGSSFPSMAPLLGMAEVSRLEKEAAAMAAIDLCAEAPALEDLVDAVSALRLEQGLARVAAPLLEALAEIVRRSMRDGRWDEVASGRARYLRRWHQLSRTVAIQRSEALVERPYLATCRLIGQKVGLMHHRAGLVSGALLLENFTEHGVIRTFESSAPATGSLANFAEDLLPLRFQLWDRHIEEFYEGYREGYEGDRETAHVMLVTVDKLARAIHDRSRSEESFPVKQLLLPHFVIRSAGHVLRTDKSRRPDFAARLQALASLSPAERMEEASKVLVEAADLNENAAQGAASVLWSSCVNLVNVGEHDLALSLLERCVSMAEDMVSPDLLYSARGLIWAVRSDLPQADPNARGLALWKAATWFARDRQWAPARNSLIVAHSHMRDPQDRGNVSLALLRMHIDAALDTQDGEYAQQATEYEIDRNGLPDSLVRRLQAHALVVLSILEPNRTSRHALVREAIGLVADLPDPDGFLALISDMVPPWEQREASRRDPLEDLVPRATMEALYRTDPVTAFDRLKSDLVAMQADGAPTPHQLLVAAKLAGIAVNLADQMPDRRQAMSEVVCELAETYQQVLQDAAGGMPAGDAPEADAANNIGWAAVTLHGNLPEDQAARLLDDGIVLLELAVEWRPAERFPGLRAFSANNLSMGYRARAHTGHGDLHMENLHRARTLMETALELDERQVRDGVTAADLGIDIDHLNIGLIYRDLADATYEAQWIHKKSMESARWLRQAALHFARAKAVAAAAGEFARAGTADTVLARAATTICERYVAERTAADGDLQRAMYDWLCTVVGVPHVSTANFIQSCAGTAIAVAADAAAIGQARNPSLLLESIQSLAKLWNLAERRNGLPEALARDVRMTVLECLQRVKDAGLDRTYAEQMPGFKDLVALLDASLQVDLVEVTGDTQYLIRAHERFQALTGSDDLVVRALARPRARWLDASESSSKATVCGLSLSGGTDGLDLRIPAQARQVRLGGLVPDHIKVELTTTADVRELARFATTHLRPMMDWDPLPTTIAQARVAGRSGRTAFSLEAVALPIPTWDTWMLRLTTSGADPIRCNPGLPFLGVSDKATGRLDETMPASVGDHTRVVLVGEPGLTMHILVPADTPDWEAPQLRLSGTPAQPVLEITATEVFLLLQATPRISSSQVAFLIKTDDAVAGAACASSFWPDKPDPGMPATGVQTFSALFPFQSRVPSAALDRIRGLPVTVVVMVGLPDDPSHLQDVLDLLVDPRREALLVVDADEFPRATAAVDRLRRRVFSRLSAQLLGSAASFGTYHEALTGIQVVQASRSSAPAAVQMLLDLAALRRVNPDDIPETVDGTPVYMRTKGNMAGMRRAETLFRSPAGFDELMTRYRELGERPLTQAVTGGLSAARSQLVSLTLPRRPVLLLMPGEPAVVAALPLARHLGAIMVFASDNGIQMCAQLAPADVYATPAAAARLPDDEWTVHELPPEPSALAVAFQALTVRSHADLLASLPAVHPELVANQALLAEMAPAGYVMLVTDSPEERPWAFLAANYAAALNAPVLVVDGLLPQRDSRLPAAARLLDGTGWRAGGSPGRDLASEEFRPPDVTPIGLDVLGAVGERLTEMAPRYLGFVTTHADFPIELIGDPPLATRCAIGRLAGPDLDSTALLIVRAALAEDVARPTRISAVVADAGLAVTARPLYGARAEAVTIRAALARQADIATTFVRGEGDLFDFLAALPDAGLVHFAGHGRYDDAEPTRSGLVFDSGILTSAGLIQPLASTPIIFSNACESGVLDASSDAAPNARANSGWTGLAASFLLNGAANYLGSLWPIYDDSSRALAEEFYELLCSGIPVGEALRRARLKVHAAGDPTWAAFVLFGCPRNRIRPAKAEEQ